MKVVSVSSVISAALIDLGLSIHWYVPLAHWGLRCFRELHFDVLKRSKQVRITLDEWGEYDLTQLTAAGGGDDFAGMVGVYEEVGGLLRQLKMSRNVNTNIRLNDDDERIAYPATNENNGYQGEWPAIWGGWRFYSVSTYRGELKGRMFGRGQFSEAGTWSIDWEREVLKIWPKEHWCEETVVLKYLSWDEASQSSVLPIYAADVLLHYMVWKFKDRGRTFSRFEVQTAKQEYYNAYRILRARMNPLNLNDIRGANRRYKRPTLNY